MHNTSVIIYTNKPEQFKGYPQVKSLQPQRVNQISRISLIATIWEEAENVTQWCEDIFNSTRLPDEIVIVDGGSQDESVELLTTQAKISPVPMHIIQAKQINIAQGRNIAISHAQYSIIAVTDFGCRPKADWLHNLAFPLEDDPEIAVVAGWYQAVDRNQNPLNRRRWSTLDQINPQEFIPSSRSLAFKKSAWQSAGGYPEWLTLTGEDTLFAYSLKEIANKWAFVPDAIVLWRAPDTITTYWKKQYQYSFGDGEARLNTPYYQRLGLQVGLFILTLLIFLILLTIVPLAYKLFLIGLIFIVIPIGIYLLLPQKKEGSKLQDITWESGAKFAQFFGYLKGSMNRKEAFALRDKMLK
jgi:GT2 family glycosyltransferase